MAVPPAAANRFGGNELECHPGRQVPVQWRASSAFAQKKPPGQMAGRLL
jgi:hypothetical protein